MRRMRRLVPSVQRTPVPPRITAISSSLTMAALIGGWVVFQVLVLGGYSQDRAQDTLYSAFREQLASATAPIAAPIEPGRPVALLEIPRLGLRQVVVEGTASSDLMAGPGHRRDTALPGQQGVSIVYGRASTFGGPFAEIGTLSPGDQIRVQTGQGELVYRVDGVRRGGDPLPAAVATGGARLTLVTGEGSGRAAGISPGEVVYVDASASEGAFPAAARSAAVPPSELAMASETTALPLLALCLGLLVALTAALAVLRRRWPLATVWMLGVPVALGLAWFSTDTAARLLPNLL